MRRALATIRAGLSAVILWLLGWLPTALITSLVALLAYNLAANQDVRERRFKFHEVTKEAEETYCRTGDGGVSASLKVLVDQATQLEKGIKDELTALNYITLASLGSVVDLPYDQVHEFGMRGLELAEADKNKVDRYSANLILGHIEFARYEELGDRHHLLAGREYFTNAKDLIDDRDISRHLYLHGQLLMIWGMNELSAKEEAAGNNAIKDAREAWSKLPQKETLAKRIDENLRLASLGIPPRFPCPGRITLLPPFEHFQGDNAGDNKPIFGASGTLLSTAEGSPGDDIVIPEMRELFESWKLDNKTQLDEVAGRLEKEIKSLAARFPVKDETKLSDVTPEPGDEEHDEKPASPQNESRRSEQPQSKSQPCDPRTNPSCCSFVVVNKIDYDVQLIINGYDGANFLISAHGFRTYYLPCTSVTIERSDNGVRKKWENQELFRNSEGKKISPTIRITSCCLTLD
jgi:hypothetical protein